MRSARWVLGQAVEQLFKAIEQLVSRPVPPLDLCDDLREIVGRMAGELNQVSH